jgi:hypothetical protein
MAYVFSFASRVVVFNTVGTYSNSGENKNPLPGFVFVYSMMELIAVLRSAGSGPVRVCFTPVRNFDITQAKKNQDSLIDIFHEVCILLMKYKHVVFAIDELWLVQRGVAPHQLPPVQQDLFLAWRHWCITPMWAAQMPQLVNSAVRSVSTESYVGKFTDTLDIDAVARCKVKDPQAMALLTTLEPFVFIHQYENGEWRLERAPAR